MTPIQDHLRAINALLVLDGWVLLGDRGGSSRTYVRANSTIALDFRASNTYTATGYVRVPDNLSGPNDLLTGYLGPEAECVASYAVEEIAGAIAVTEIVGDEATQTTSVVEHQFRSAEEFFRALAARTDTEVRRRLSD